MRTEGGTLGASSIAQTAQDGSSRREWRTVTKVVLKLVLVTKRLCHCVQGALVPKEGWAEARVGYLPKGIGC